MLQHTRINELVTSSSFSTPTGIDEFYITCETREAVSFENALSKLKDNYFLALEKLGLSNKSLVFCRFYLSDIENQKDVLNKSEIFSSMCFGAASVIGQPPCSADAIVLLAYHVRGKNEFLRKISTDKTIAPWCSEVSIQGKHYSMLWASNLAKPGEMDSKKQTENLFADYGEYLRAKNLSIRNNLVRTWIYVRDIDNNYQGMVDARRSFFSAEGLTSNTRFVASTGIEGKATDSRTLVSMDSLAIGSIEDAQIETMNALENMSPTINYGVTFERGLRIKFGDRSHLHISGTASIDKTGKILHEGNVEKQTLVTIDNIEALLKNQGAILSDMSHILCYIRNTKDQAVVQTILKNRIPRDMPLIMVHGPVCRPGWLVEMEGVAIMPDKNEFPPFF